MPTLASVTILGEMGGRELFANFTPNAPEHGLVCDLQVGVRYIPTVVTYLERDGFTYKLVTRAHTRVIYIVLGDREVAEGVNTIRTQLKPFARLQPPQYWYRLDPQTVIYVTDPMPDTDEVQGDHVPHQLIRFQQSQSKGMRAAFPRAVWEKFGDMIRSTGLCTEFGLEDDSMIDVVISPSQAETFPNCVPDMLDAFMLAAGMAP